MSGQLALPGEEVFFGEAVHQRPDRNLSERQILEAVQRGNKEAYGMIVKKYMQSAYYIVLGFVHNQQDALDISQDAFIKAFRKIKMYDIHKPFFPWFYRLMRNLCLDHLKKKQHMRQIPLDDVPILSAEKEDKELKKAVWKGIEALPFEQHQPV